MSDAINPDHYMKHGDIEHIDVQRAVLGELGFRSFCMGNALKYVWRAGHKDQFEQDVKKAIWYLRQAIGDDPREDGPVDVEPEDCRLCGYPIAIHAIDRNRGGITYCPKFGQSTST